MKSIILVAAFAVVSVAAGYATKTNYGYQSAPVVVAAPAPIALASTGSSSQFRQQDNYGNSNFGYDESHATGASSRREETVNGVTRGSYSLSDVDGRRRVVTYIADVDGFRANVQTNEPGVEPKDPADVLINKAAVAVAPAPVVVAAPVPAPAPIAIAAPLPAPLPIAAPLPAPIFRSAPIVQQASYGAVKGYSKLAAPSVVAPTLAVAEPIAVAETPRAFSYNIGVSHLAAPVAPRYQAPVYGPAPIALEQAPIVQQQQTLDY